MLLPARNRRDHEDIPPSIDELGAAEQSELQALRRLRNAGEEWIRIKEELGDRGLNIADWCKAHMPVSRQWLDRHAELAKGWRRFLSARKWANDVGYTSRRRVRARLRA